MRSSKIHCEIVFTEDMVDPLYKDLGLNVDADVVEIVEDGMIDLTHVVAVNRHYEMSQIYLNSGQSLIINMEFDYFCALWKQI